MKLSKLLYIMISIMFFAIFAGNFFITLQNTKSYLQKESQSKIQDAATTLGLRIKELISNKKDPEIQSLINAVADSGFYKEIRLEDIYYTITDKDLIVSNKKLNDLSWNISDVSVDKKLGKLLVSNQEELSNELDQLEGVVSKNNSTVITDHTYTFLPSENFNEKNELKITYTAAMNNKLLDTFSNIKLTKILAINKRDIKFDNVPSWFIKLIDIKIEEKNTQISDDWKTAAVLYISANPGIAYEKLYLQLKLALSYSIIAFIISMIVLYLFLKLILNPLKKIEELANNISDGNFKQIKDLPYTQELRVVTNSMNNMSLKIKNIIDKLNEEVEEKSKKMHIDELTSLEIEQTFLSDIKNMFVEKKDGYISLVKMFDLTEFSKTHSLNEVDNYIVKFANILNNLDNMKAYRILGSQFALITYDSDENKLIKNLQRLKEQLNEMSKEYDVNDIAHIGVTKFNKYSTVDSLINSANDAYQTAKLIGQNEYSVNENDQYTKDIKQWKNLIFDVIDNSKFNLEYIGDILDIKNNNLLIKEAFSNINDNGNNIAIGTFISIAQEYGKIIDFDKKVINKVINDINNLNFNHNIIINLSIESIKDTAFKTYLVDTLIQNKQIANQLIFTITAYNIQKSIDEFINFTKIVKKFGAKTMIKRFEVRFITTNDISLLKPNCIRLARDYTNGICNDNIKKDLVESLCKVSNLLDVEVYCENVKEKFDYEYICKLDIKGASR